MDNSNQSLLRKIHWHLIPHVLRNFKHVHTSVEAAAAFTDYSHILFFIDKALEKLRISDDAVANSLLDISNTPNHIRHYTAPCNYNNFHESSSKSRSLAALYKLTIMSLAVSVIILEKNDVRHITRLSTMKTNVWGAMRIKWAVDPERC